MRIVCLSFWFFDYTIQLANKLSEKNKVMLMLPEHTSIEYLENIDETIELHLFKFPKHLYYPSIIPIIYRIIRQINSFKPDVVHFQVSNVLLCALLPLLKKYPLIGTFHDVRPHIGEENLLHEFMFFCSRKYLDQIIVHGKAPKEIIMGEQNTPLEKVNAITIGEHEVAPFIKYTRGDLKDKRNLILFFGRIRNYKGLEYLIKAEPLITKQIPNAIIVIAGDGQSLKKYRNIMVNKENFIIYNYRIPYKDGAKLFQECSIVVLPYIEASQSGVIPTAYSFKKPVVVTNVGAIPEIVDEGKTGFIVPPKNPEALAEAIIKLLKNDDLRKRMGENAYKKLKTDLSWDKITEKTIEVYKKAMEVRNHKK
jgi:starch synthase